jgi:hypothetical protein
MSIGRALSVLGFSALAGCGASNDGPKVGNGVNDVRAACEIKAKWVATDQNQCYICAASVLYPRCSCTALAAFSGACSDQADARKPVCPQSIDDCVNGCKANDCDCLDTCYANNEACKAASGARDGCQVDACSQYCK